MEFPILHSAALLVRGEGNSLVIQFHGSRRVVRDRFCEGRGVLRSDRGLCLRGGKSSCRGLARGGDWSGVGGRGSFSFQNAFVDTGVDAKSGRHEGFQEYGVGVLVYQTIFDIIAEAVVKSIEEGLVVPSNVSLKAAKLGGIGRYGAGMAEGARASVNRFHEICDH